MKKLKLTEHQKKYINKNAKVWIQELLTDDLPQAKGELQSNKGFCCLGVACLEYEIKTGNELPKVNGLYHGTDLSFYSYGETLDPSKQVAQWLGLGNEGGISRNIDISHHLTFLNDTEGFKFSEIAERLLEYPELYFNPIKED